ncbi:MAG: glycosyltransferase family 4 protein [Aquabacterium sp.]|uniref:glycosyltransferase family 4 protein n=1 Tax=Aquabacterium sp. TaxID=1872578 RepID=UPI0027264C48|nr:glycosyltransferase family 4 protein [Aquabacterium sp.]MDO9002231.1 glycosyltransferase family 4 protein [Aquabacterium sp.]
MKVVLSAPGRFHTFDLARELHAHRCLEALFTGYPRFKLGREGLPPDKVRSWPWVQASYMAMPKRHLLGKRLVREWEWLSKTSLDAHVARHLPACDVFVGLSGSGLRSGQAAQARGARYVCDRGSSHIRVQDTLLREESDRWGVPFDGIDPRVIAREEAEYEMADCITVPSSFSVMSFIQAGVPAHKLRMLPYGVNLQMFKPTGQPVPGQFDVLYVGGMNLNKGLPYLLQAYKMIRHPRKSLTFAGAPSPVFIERMKAHGLWPDELRLLGHVPQAELKSLMSQSHAMVLPSVQDGFGMVLSQAMACGCVVIGTDHTGARDLLTDGREGFIVPTRQSEALAARLQSLADNPAKRAEMSRQALLKVKDAGGWRDYGTSARSIYQALGRA